MRRAQELPESRRKGDDKTKPQLLARQKPGKHHRILAPRSSAKPQKVQQSSEELNGHPRNVAAAGGIAPTTRGEPAAKYQVWNLRTLAPPLRSEPFNAAFGQRGGLQKDFKAASICVCVSVQAICVYGRTHTHITFCRSIFRCGYFSFSSLSGGSQIACTWGL